MAESSDDNKKTGVTHFALEEEKKNQERVPPRGASKEEIKTTSQSTPEQNAPLAVAEDADEQTISRRSAKGGESGGGAD
ncbi:hypothetical protein [Nitrospira sp. Nam74]